MDDTAKSTTHPSTTTVNPSARRETCERRVMIRLSPYEQRCLATVCRDGLPAEATPQPMSQAIVELIVRRAAEIQAREASSGGSSGRPKTT